MTCGKARAYLTVSHFVRLVTALCGKPSARSERSAPDICVIARKI
jgi:hypothetical protein